MSLIWFFKLKEIDSLLKESHREESLKNEQLNRLIALNKRLEGSRMESEESRLKLKELQDKLFRIESKLKSDTEQKQRLVDFGGDEVKINEYSQLIETGENEGMELLEEIELLQNEIKQSKTFQEGLLKTIEEIDEEVKTEVTKIDNGLENLKMRINLLLDELPSNFKNALNKALSKNLIHGPFTRVEQGSCYLCRFKISRVEESEIEIGKTLKNCSQCSRIFLPYGS